MKSYRVWNARTVFVLGLIIVCIGATSVFAQEPEPPFTWKGEGTALIVGEEGIKEISFTAKVDVDSDGWVNGKLCDGDDCATIERVYYAPFIEGAQKLYIVLSVKDGEKDKLVLLDCRMIAGMLLYGEILIKDFVKEGEIEKGLSIGDKVAQEIYEDYMPTGLKKALKAFKPCGAMAIKGNFVK